MLYSVINIAKYIVSECTRIGKPISNLKLQKLLYFIWIDFFKCTEGMYLFGNSFHTKNSGPYVPDAYYEFCCYGGNPISRQYETNIDPEFIFILNILIAKYADIPTYELDRRSRRPESPWDQLHKTHDDTAIIPFSMIIQLECR